MNENQKQAIQKLNSRLICEPNIDEIILKLRSQEILTMVDNDALKSAATTRERRQKLLDIIIKLENSWNPFLDALDRADLHYLRIELESEANGIATDQFKQYLIPELESYIKSEAEHIRKFWKEYLEVVELNDIYQPLEIVEIKGQNVEKHIVEGYDFIWNNPSRKLFLIDGDPGIGKTTWLNKLAIIWTNKDAAIRQKFDLIFLVPLRYLNSPTLDALLKNLSHLFGQIDSGRIATCLKLSTTLLLLDGFNENPSCIELISKLTVKNGYHCKILITSRESHSDEIRKICDMRLMVKGFKEEAVYRFFEIQNCEKSKKIFDSYSQLPEMCKVPMIAAILCSIYKYNDVSEEVEKDENCTLFIIVDYLVKMLINMAEGNRSNVFNKKKDEKKVMEALGKFALATVKRQ